MVSSPLTPEQQEGHCLTSQPTPEPPVSDGPEEPQPPTLDIMPKTDNKPVQTAQDSAVIRLSDGPDGEGLTGQEKKSGSGDDSCKEPLPKDLLEGYAFDKDQVLDGRRRRFTGDSGIEVCVCGTRRSGGYSAAGGKSPEGKELRELESLLGRQGEDAEESEERAGDFCDSCGQQASLGVEQEQSGPPQLSDQRADASPTPPVCLLLHTIDEH